MLLLAKHEAGLEVDSAELAGVRKGVKQDAKWLSSGEAAADVDGLVDKLHSAFGGDSH